MPIDRWHKTTKVETPWWSYPLQALEWAVSPFTLSGEAVREAWERTINPEPSVYPVQPSEKLLEFIKEHPEKSALTEKDLRDLAAYKRYQEQAQRPIMANITEALPGGKIYEEYRQLPMWQQFAFEMPATLATMGIGAEATTPAKLFEAIGKSGMTATGAEAERLIPQLVKQALKTGEGGVVKTAEEITDPLMQKMNRLLRMAEKATKATEESRHLARSARSAEISKWLKVAEEAKTPEEMEAALAKASAARSGKMPTVTVSEYEYAQALRSGAEVEPGALGEIFTKDEIFQAQQKILKSKLMPYQKIKLTKESLGKFVSTTETLQESEIAMFEKVFPGFRELNNFKDSIIRSGGNRAWELTMEIINLPRAMMTAGDWSATLRQLGMGLTRFPDSLKNVILVEAKTTFSPKNYRLIMEAIESHPDYLTWVDRMGIHFGTEPGKTISHIVAKEEYYMTNLPYKIPGLKQFIGASERPFTGAINYMRADIAERYLNLARKLDPTLAEAIAKNYLRKRQSQMLNWFGRLAMATTGRGSIPKALQSSSPLLNAFFFAPRYVISRLEIPYMIVRPGIPWAVRKEAIRTFTQFMSAGAAVLGTASLAGAKIEMNPRSSDFGKIRIGNTRLDIWTGYAQWIRFMAQLYTGERKIPSTGKVTSAQRSDIVWNLLQSKEAPLASIITDLIKGETFLGEPMFEGGWATLRRELRDRLGPLFAQDLLDAIEADGMYGSLIAPAAFLGVGAVSYKPEYTALPGLPQLPKAPSYTMP